MLAALVLLALQEGSSPPRRTLDRAIPVDIATTDPALAGHGPSKRVEHTVEFSGALHVWTKVEGEFDTFLRVEDPEGKLLGEDDDSGGKPTPYLKLTVEAGQRLRIAVASARPDGTGHAELHLVGVEETEATRAEAQRVREEVAEIKKLHASEDLDGARARARELVDRLVDLEEKTGSEALAERAWSVGFEVDSLGLVESTERIWRLMLVHSSRTLPGDHPNLQWARGNLANQMRQLGKLAGAKELEEQVLEVRSRTLNGDDPALQLAKQNLALTAKTLGDLARARTLEEQVLEVRSRTLTADHADLQKARGNLAGTLYLLGDLEGARTLFERVLEISARTLPSDDPYLQMARVNLALVIRDLGHLTEARALQEQALDSLSKTLGEDHPQVQTVREHLATTLQALGDRARARTLEGEVLEFRSRTMPADHVDIQRARLHLGTTLYSLGDFAGAGNLEEEACEALARTLPESDLTLQGARTILATTLLAEGDLPGARALFEKAIEATSSTLSENHPHLRSARGNLALVLKAQGDFAAARTLEEGVLDLLSRTHPDDHHDLQEAQGHLADTIARQAARVAEGKEGKARSEDRKKFTELARSLIASLSKVARGAVLGAAAREVEERIGSQIRLDQVLSMADGYGVFDPEPALCEPIFLLSEITRNAGLLGARLARAGGEEPELVELRAELRGFADELARLAQRGATTAEFSETRANLDRVQGELVNRGKKLEPGVAAALGADLATLSAHVAPNEALIGYRRYSRTRVDPNGEESTVPNLCAFVLRSGGRLRRIGLGDMKPVDRAVESWRASIGAGAPNGPERGKPVTTSSSEGRASAGEELRKLVLDPLLGDLKGVEKIVVALDDVLFVVPLDALPAGASWTNRARGETHGQETQRRTIKDALMIGDVVQVQYRGSLLEVLDAPTPPSPGGALLAFGFPAYDRAGTLEPESTKAPPALETGDASARPDAAAGILRGSRWAGGFDSLPATLDEVEGLAASHAEAFGKDAPRELLTGARASREALAALAPTARWMHIATHGWYAPDSIRSSADPMPLETRQGAGPRVGLEEQVKEMSPLLLCGLALAGANLPENEFGRIPGLVTAEEIAALDLRNCELAVLSACDTNVGELSRAGQGVASLQKALHMAGARSVITSLWKVPDRATQELMLGFYRRLWIEKKSKSVALWEAKKTLREARDERGSLRYSTRDWAAWVLTGEAQ